VALEIKPDKSTQTEQTSIHKHSLIPKTPTQHQDKPRHTQPSTKQTFTERKLSLPQTIMRTHSSPQLLNKSKIINDTFGGTPANKIPRNTPNKSLNRKTYLIPHNNNKAKPHPNPKKEQKKPKTHTKLRHRNKKS